jgi:hypothetical protein
MNFHIALALAMVSQATAMAVPYGDDVDLRLKDCMASLAPCSRELEPVCNDEGEIFGNLCALQIAHCLDGVSNTVEPCPSQKLRSMYASDSLSDSRRSSPATTTYVGGQFDSNGFWVWDDSHPALQSASSMSDAMAAAGRKSCSKKNKKPSKAEQSEGDCETACNKVFLPVCGDDDVIYANECLFEQAQCKDPSLEMVECDSRRR